MDNVYTYIDAYHRGGLWWFKDDAVAGGERGGGLLDGDQQRVVTRRAKNKIRDSIHLKHVLGIHSP